MTIVQKLKKLFREIHGVEIKPDTITWKDIGLRVGTTGQAAKAIWKRYRNEQKAKQVTMKQNVKSIKKHPHQGTHLILGCVHVPFQNQKILDGVYRLMDDIQFDGLHLIGDFLDMNTLSSYDRGRFTAIPNLTLNQEYAAGNEVLDNFDSLLPDNCLKTFIYGNHEHRYKSWMATMDNAKTPLVSPEEALELEKRGYDVYTSWNKDFFVLGEHLELLHGEYFNLHTAKKHLDTLRSSCLFAHTHRIQSYVEGNSAAFNIGWLGDKDSAAFSYAGRAQKSMWQNGFAVVTIDENGDYFVEQIIVCNDRFVYGGKLY